MGEYRVEFEHPWFLLLLILIPLFWIFSFRSLAGLGKFRRILALVIRSAVTAIIVCALAGIQWVRSTDRITVLYLLDQSLSIPEQQRKEMTAFVNASVKEHRKEGDRVGVVVFGRDAAMEVPPLDDRIRVTEQIEALIDREATNLEGALKMALASFPEGSAKRIVVVSDFSQNVGNAVEQARLLAEKGVSIDVRPVRYDNTAEIIVDKLARPTDVRRGQPFDLRAVLTNTGDREVRGRLQFLQRTDDEPIVLNDDPAQQEVTLRPGKNVFSLRRELSEPNYYEYEVRFLAASQADDAMIENNHAATYVHVKGSGQVLLIEDQDHPGEHSFLVDRLRANNIEVKVRSSAQAFSSLPELQQYDCVVLANVPREDFTDSQISMLVSNTENTGSGLVMLGGPNSFGAGGWTNSELEKAMPLDFQIQNAQVMPKGALVMIMHASEIAQGNYWQKIIAQEALKTLGDMDYCGVVHWNGRPDWLWGKPKGCIKIGGQRDLMLAKLDKMFPGDMPEFDPSLKMALTSLKGITDASAKHVIVISDGDPTQPSNAIKKAFVDAKVTVSTVAVGAHGTIEENVLSKLAKDTKGNFYPVKNNKTLPRIFQKEARRVARPLIYETPPPQSPQRRYPHEMIEGLPDALPPISGYVMTTIKQNSLVEVSLLAPAPKGRENAVLASWTYGLGRAVCLTTDAGSRWANQWTSWEGYDKFYTQMIRWSMRPSQDDSKFSVATEVENGQVKVVVTALDKEDEYLNLLNMAGRAVDPNNTGKDFAIKQVAPGRYVGTVDAKDAGTHFLMISTGPGKPPLRVGVNIPYSAEFRERTTDEALAVELARLVPEGGKPGQVLEVATVNPANKNKDLPNPFRRDLPRARTGQDAWFVLVVIACCVFFADVFVRRVQVDLSWVQPAMATATNFVLRRQAEALRSEYMSRLRSRKEEVSEQIEQLKAAARFEPQPDAPAGDAVADELSQRPAAAGPPKLAPGMKPQADEDTYTNRLLKAKKKALEDRKK
ncbi:MAG: VWA domain-containing protein [Planctomycetia bacterium]|nr:VWA domain-containing protein [Planctomycetia bacterium]